MPGIISRIPLLNWPHVYGQIKGPIGGRDGGLWWAGNTGSNVPCSYSATEPVYYPGSSGDGWVWWEGVVRDWVGGRGIRGWGVENGEKAENYQKIFIIAVPYYRCTIENNRSTHFWKVK